ncbi:MAG TPA: hypothetical protein VKT54_13985 [Steroidobacteraceae bacterium]|nr:hypothetical protein [Steroidobacteraceae bacterium]
MILLLALIPATALTMAGYVVLYVSKRNEGALSTFGRWLAFWAFTLAALVVLGGVFAAGRMHREGPRGFWSRHHGWSEERRDFDRGERPEPGAPPPGAPGADVSPQPPSPAPSGAK